MNALWSLINLLVYIQIATCRDFYLGMFKRNDFLVAQDNIYKPPAPFGFTTASYGRLFKCPITYFRVVDRLGMGRGPITTIVRGGLRKKFISVRIKSTGYRLPISVNIYVGCENKKPSTFRTTLTTTKLTSTHATTKKTADDRNATTIPGKDTDKTTDSNDDATTAGKDVTAEDKTANTDSSDRVTTEEGSVTTSSDDGQTTVANGTGEITTGTGTVDPTTVPPPD